MGIPVFKHGTINKDDTTKILIKLQPDLILVVGWRYMLCKEQYSIPSKGCIVIHDSLLPKYRGFAPMNWAIINGEKSTGATMIYIADEVDAGDIIAQKTVAIDILDNANTLDARIISLYLELISENLPLIASGKAARVPQDHTQATYTCKRTPEDGVIDWSKSASEIYNLIRGLTDPYPGAFTYLKTGSRLEKLYVWRAALDNENKRYVGCIPGRVTQILRGRGVRVLTGDGTVVIEDVQRANQQSKVKADEIINSIKITLGANTSLWPIGGHAH